MATLFAVSAAGTVAQTPRGWSVASPDGRTTIAVATPEWPGVVQLIALTADKKIVRALRDWDTLGPASSTELLDQKGYR